MDRDTFMDDLFADGAKQQKEYYGDRIWHYDIDDQYEIESKGIRVSGECHVIDVRYNKSLDCNVFTVKDIKTNETYTANEFSITLSFV